MFNAWIEVAVTVSGGTGSITFYLPIGKLCIVALKGPVGAICNFTVTDADSFPFVGAESEEANKYCELLPEAPTKASQYTLNITGASISGTYTVLFGAENRMA